MFLRSGSFMVGDTKKIKKVSIKLMASLAPARAEVEAGVVAMVRFSKTLSAKSHICWRERINDFRLYPFVLQLKI